MMAAISKKNYRVIIVTPTYALAGKQYKEIAKVLKQIPMLVTSANSSTFTIELRNGSSIMFKSAEAGEALRGFTAELLIIDEAAYVGLDVATSCCFPYVNTTDGDIILFSTPSVKSDNNLFSKFFFLAETGTKIHKVDWTLPKYDLSPMLSPERKQLYKETLPTKVYLSEIEGQFLDEQSTVFGDYGKVLSNSFNINDNEYSMGIDWGTGSGEDDTAIAIFNGQRQMVKLRYFNDKKPLDGIQEIIRIIKEYRPKNITVEWNSIGQVNYDLLRTELNKAGIRTTLSKFNTDNTSKRKIIENLALAIERREIQLLNDPKLSLEFATYEVQSTASGKSITYNATKGGHDDIVIATAIAFDSLNKATYHIR